MILLLIQCNVLGKNEVINVGRYTGCPKTLAARLFNFWVFFGGKISHNVHRVVICFINARLFNSHFSLTYSSFRMNFCLWWHFYLQIRYIKWEPSHYSSFAGYCNKKIHTLSFKTLGRGSKLTVHDTSGAVSFRFLLKKLKMYTRTYLLSVT